MGLVTVFSPLTTIGSGETVVQAAGETRLVVDCKAKPVATTGSLGSLRRNLASQREGCYSASMTAADVLHHIRLDERGVAWIDDTRSRVIEVAMEHISYGWGAEEIHRQHPHLSLAQTHAALA